MLERGKLFQLAQPTDTVKNAAAVTRDTTPIIGHAASHEVNRRRPATQLALIIPPSPPAPRGRFSPIVGWLAVGAVIGACVVTGAIALASAETTPDLVYQARPVVESDDLSALNELFAVWGIGDTSEVLEGAMIIDEPEIRMFVTPMPGENNSQRCVFVDSVRFGTSALGCAESPWPIVRDGPVSELGFTVWLQNRLGVESSDSAFIMFDDDEFKIWLNEELPSPER